MESINQQVQKRPLPMLLIALLVGFFVGLVIFGWWLTPVNYVDGGPQHLSERDLKIYLGALADAYAADGNADRVLYALCWWDEDPNTATQEVSAELQTLTLSDPANAAKYNSLLTVISQEDCATFRARVEGQPVPIDPAAPAASESIFSGNLVRILAFLAILLLMLGVLFYILSRRQQKNSGAQPLPSSSSAAASTGFTPAVQSQEPEAALLASFKTTYQHGDETYDKSYIIESDTGEFLGECGITTAEVVSADDGRNVMAFEVWLFDKNDTQTVTKVLMSKGAYADDGIQAKLATRGDLVEAEVGQTIPLETASLIINAEVQELEYRDDQIETPHVFDLLTIDLSAWVKSDGMQQQSGGGGTEPGAADLLDF
jgi:hypothetical protein